MKRVLIIGHQCYDVRGGQKITGGAAMYQVPIFLSFNWHVTLLTSVGVNYPLPEHTNLEIINQKSPETTEFLYLQTSGKDQDDRVLVLKNRASMIDPSIFETTPAEFDVIVISGIAGEISLDLIEVICNSFPSIPIFLDLQSITRHILKDGHIEIKPVSASELHKLSCITGFKASNIEFRDKNDTSILDHQQLIITSGSGHIQVISGNKSQDCDLETYGTDIVIDATGSGDIFLAAYIHYLLNGEKIGAAIKKAHKIALLHLKIEGAPSIVTSEKIISNL